MHTFKLGVTGVGIAFEFSGTRQVCARTPATALPSSESSAPSAVRGMASEVMPEIDAATVLFPRATVLVVENWCIATQESRRCRLLSGCLRGRGVACVLPSLLLGVPAISALRQPCRKDDRYA
jgi:hypothetical protein